MKENKNVDLTKEETELLRFYRALPENKKDKFMKLIASIRKILLDDLN